MNTCACCGDPLADTRTGCDLQDHCDNRDCSLACPCCGAEVADDMAAEQALDHARGK